MDKKHQFEPWQQGVYETGRTRPPKNHSALIAGLLVVVIFLGGLVSALGVLNIRLFAQLKQQPEPSAPISFVAEPDSIEPPEETQAAAAEQLPPQQELTLSLNPSPHSVENIPQEGGLSLQEIYKKNIPSVVSISCSLPEGTATGTGVITSASGYIVTNSHVVDGAYQITVRLTDERSLNASLVGTDAVTDLAVLQIEAENLVPAEFGDSSVLRVGDAVAAIGDPLGSQLRGTMTNGIVSAINRDITAQGRTLSLIQTNADLNSGNSGGPLLNCYGQVVGINTMKIGAFTDQAGVEGLGFAIPSTTVKDIVEQLIANGYVPGRPSLGISGDSISRFYQHYYRLPAGVYISRIDPSSTADQAGIVPGDILISIDGISIATSEALSAAVADHQVGDTVTVVIYRAGKQYQAELVLGESRG